MACAVNGGRQRCVGRCHQMFHHCRGVRRKSVNLLHCQCVMLIGLHLSCRSSLYSIRWSMRRCLSVIFVSHRFVRRCASMCASVGEVSRCVRLLVGCASVGGVM